MTDGHDELSIRLGVLEERLAKVERQNRFFRGILGTAITIAVGLATMAQVAGRTAPRLPATVEARQFILRDAHGIERANLSVRGNNDATLTFYDSSGSPALVLNSGHFLGSLRFGPSLELYSGQQGPSLGKLSPHAGVTMGDFLGTPYIQLSGNSVGTQLDLWPNDVVLQHRTALAAPSSSVPVASGPPVQGWGLADLGITASGDPSLTMSDANGFESVLGHVVTQQIVGGAGEQFTRSAASLTFFGNDKDHRVIYQVP